MAKPKNIPKRIISEIRETYTTGAMNQSELAKKFELSQSTISKIINNEIHKRKEIIVSGESVAKITQVKFKYGN